jgi:hypothetical protein
MPSLPIPLLSGAYSRNPVSSLQRCINLYPEVNPAEVKAPMPVTHLPTSGVVLQRQLTAGACRGYYRASNGVLYVVVGDTVYLIDANLNETVIGAISVETTPVSMADNGLALVIVDGSADGWAVDLTTQAFGRIVGDGWRGGNSVRYLFTYFVFNVPNTPQFYISLSNVTAAMLTGGTGFDPLDFATKTGYPDNIVAIEVLHEEIWLIGSQKTSIYYNSGAADFTFSELPGSFIEHGCAARFSVNLSDVSLIWLAKDKDGSAIVVKTEGYQVVRISNHALEAEFQKYARIDDAVAYSYQQDGHVFYVINFPTADKTWAYDSATKQWHERVSLDANGAYHRHIVALGGSAYDKVLGLDKASGALYAFDPDTMTDNGKRVLRLRSFPQITNENKRVIYWSFIADLEVGNASQIAGSDRQITLRYSDDRGKSWSEPLTQTMGDEGEYDTSISWNQLGMGRNRVFELSWDVPVKCALNGAYVQLESADS